MRVEVFRVAINEHIARFAPAVAVPLDKVYVLIAHSVELAMKYVAASGLNQSKTPLLEGLNALSAMAETSSPSSREFKRPDVDNGDRPLDAGEPRTAGDIPPPERTLHENQPPAQSSLTLRLARAWRSMF